MKLFRPMLATGILMTTTLAAQAAAPADWKQSLAKTTDEYFDQVYFHYAPTNGTVAGFHQFDTQLENYSRSSIDEQIAALQKFEQRIAAIQPDMSKADLVPRSDRAMLLGNIHSELLTLQTIRPWEKNADNYSSACANGAFTLMERKFDSPSALRHCPRKTDAGVT
jgi:hypothetical protein